MRKPKYNFNTVNKDSESDMICTILNTRKIGSLRYPMSRFAQLKVFKAQIAVYDLSFEIVLVSKGSKKILHLVENRERNLISEKAKILFETVSTGER